MKKLFASAAFATLAGYAWAAQHGSAGGLAHSSIVNLSDSWVYALIAVGGVYLLVSRRRHDD